MTTPARYAALFSRSQQLTLAPRIRVEAFYFPDATTHEVLLTTSPAVDFPLQEICTREALFAAAPLELWLEEFSSDVWPRLQQALKKSGYELPPGTFVLNLNGTRWHGHGRFELAMILALLGASEQISLETLRLRDIFGALNSHGDVCQPLHSLFVAVKASTEEERIVMLPGEVAAECELVHGARLERAYSIKALFEPKAEPEPSRLQATLAREARVARPDMKELQVPFAVKQAVIIAAAGKHSMLIRDASNGAGAQVLALHLAGVLPLLDAATAEAHAALQSLHSIRVQRDRWAQPECYAIEPGDSTRDTFGEGGTHIGALAAARYGVLFATFMNLAGPHRLQALTECWTRNSMTLHAEDGPVNVPVAQQWVLALPVCPFGEPLLNKGRCNCKPKRHARAFIHLPAQLLDRCALQLWCGTSVPQMDTRGFRPPQHRNFGALEVMQAQALQRERNARFAPPQSGGLLYGELRSEQLAVLMSENTAALAPLVAARKRHQWSQVKTDAVFAVALTIASLDFRMELHAADVHKAIGLCDGSFTTSF